MPKIVLLGISGLDPQLVEFWLDDLHEIRRMQEEGIWGKLQSTIPPDTAPAWTCAMSGRSPGLFGFWGFRYRDNATYKESKTIDCRVKDQRVKSLYNILPLWGEKVAIINVPITWPPPRIPGGYSISCQLTPGLEQGFTWPKSLPDEMKELIGEYIIDIKTNLENHIQIEKEEAKKRMYEMDGQRFTLIWHFITKKQCDAVITRVTGADRMARLFYRYFDKQHRRYDPEPIYTEALHDYYVWVDQQLKDLRSSFAEEPVLFIFSDHGIQRLDGWINLNEWLIKEGYVVLRKYPSEPTPFEELEVDWSKTKAWATGCSGQIYLNKKGREPEGIVESDNMYELIDKLISGLNQILDDKSNALETKIFKGEQAYSGQYIDYAPDLFVLFDGGHWKTNEMVGYGEGNIYSFDLTSNENDIAESLYGYFCISGAGIPPNGRYEGASLLDIAPTVMDVRDLTIPEEMEGVSLSGKERSQEEEEAIAKERLKFSGY